MIINRVRQAEQLTTYEEVEAAAREDLRLGNGYIARALDLALARQEGLINSSLAGTEETFTRRRMEAAREVFDWLEARMED